MIKDTIEKSGDRATLEALLVAALVDNDDWRVLTELATSAGHGDLAARFAQALAEERQHLARVRGWAARTARASRTTHHAGGARTSGRRHPDRPSQPGRP